MTPLGVNLVLPGYWKLLSNSSAFLKSGLYDSGHLTCGNGLYQCSMESLGKGNMHSLCKYSVYREVHFSADSQITMGDSYLCPTA